MIEIKGISKSYHLLKVLEDISLTIGDAERWVILGPSGCGKSTLLRLIAGFETPILGKISIDGRIVSTSKEIIPPHERKIGMVFQSLALWPHLTVFENIDFCLRPKIASPKERAKKIEEILELVNLNKYERFYPDKLSGGERQRVALARAIAPEPKILLLDEPLANLDFLLKEELQNMVIRLQEKKQFTLIYVTHDEDEACIMAGSIGLIYKGNLQRIDGYASLNREERSEFIREFLRKKFKESGFAST